MNDDTIHIFDVYQHPKHGLQAVRRGFSLEAFLLPAVWAVRRGLGWATLVLFVLTTAVFDVAGLMANAGVAGPLQFVTIITLLGMVGLVPGIDGFRWQAAALEREGYAHLRTVAAANRQQALSATARNRFGEAAIFVAA